VAVSGRVVWIGLRPARRRAPVVVSEAQVLAGRGLVGDRAEARPSRVRQVTLIDAAAISAGALQLGLATIDPALLRRNLVVEGVDFAAARGQRLRLGEVLLAISGPCDPCARMDEALGEGAFEALRDRGGLTATVLEGGIVRIGSPVAIERLWGGVPSGLARWRIEGIVPLLDARGAAGLRDEFQRGRLPRHATPLQGFVDEWCHPLFLWFRHRDPLEIPAEQLDLQPAVGEGVGRGEAERRDEGEERSAHGVGGWGAAVGSDAEDLPGAGEGLHRLLVLAGLVEGFPFGPEARGFIEFRGG